ncbi:hypothetical protein FKR81_38120 [Lentzea tibetensis]|uniref:Excreted virulence factor EspC, type VII ESX diderm n=1 Tax=Lentzea tibetensis TaxID=2591470 RepID=A0A563EHB4_9PSEU|nr:hypothetical protein [Lentzea tibetensis]TWP45793.1 hypothetical protein FKR81_38120 [Lentzea tibetensis]
MSDLYTSLHALRSDAAVWRNVAHDVETLRPVVGELYLADAHIGSVAVDHGMGRLLEDLRLAVDSLLGGAGRTFREISDTLGRTADTYLNEETGNLHTMNRIEGQL